jgi:translation initiation factor eIF-2B subunit delta
MSVKIQDIKKDRYSGSFEISQNALRTLLDYIKKNNTKRAQKFVEECNTFSKDIIKSQPNMVSIRKKVSAVNYHMKRLLKSEKTVDEIKITSASKIEELIKNSEDRKQEIGNIGAKLIFNQSKILTISASSIVKEILYTAKKMNRKFSVYCLESRPQNEGHLLAVELSNNGIPCTLTTDAMMGQILNEVNMVICGADRLFESGFVNKTGSLPLALTAQIYKVPLYVAAETDKILKEIDRSLRFYPKDPKEILKSKNTLLSVSNYYFESIPYDYVSKIICEDGVFDINEFISWYLKD